MEVLSVFIALVCVGTVIYFRLTDVRNGTVDTLQNYLKQSEKRIESMIQKKEKAFADRMIESEIVIDRMYKMAETLSEKVDHFDGDIVKGEEIFDELKKELSGVQYELNEYKQIRSEFKDIEDRISAILDIKQRAEDGTLELNQLKNNINSFKDEYEQLTDVIKKESRRELDEFFQAMQNDFSIYLTKARQQLADKDVEMTKKIQEFSTATGSLGNQILDFKEYAQDSIKQLKEGFEQDVVVAKNASDSNVTEIYDMWNTLKNQTQQDKDYILNTVNEQKEYFETAEHNLRSDIAQFNSTLATLSDELQTNLHLNIQEKSQDLDKKITDAYTDIEKKGVEVQENISQTLESQITSVRDELDRLHSAFVDQEQGIEDRIRVLSSRVSEGLSLAENSFQNSLTDLQNTLDTTKNYSDEILQEAQKQIEAKIITIEDDFKEKANENMLKLEDSFKEINQDRVAKSIEGITASLENDFKQHYENTINEIYQKSEELAKTVNERMSEINKLDNHLEEIKDVFNDEKSKIILMCDELEKDREQSADIVVQQVKAYLDQLEEELTNSIQKSFEESTQSIINDQESWQERYDEIVKQAREEFHKIKQETDGIHRFLADLEDKSLSGLNREAERIKNDSEHKMEDLKKQISDLLRNSKEDFFVQIDQAKDEVKNLRQELWSQEKELRELVERDFDRFNDKSKDVDKQVQIFLKKSEKLDQVEDLMRKLNQQHEEVSVLKNDLGQIYDQLKESHNAGQETIQKLNDSAQELQLSSSEADKVQEQLISTIKEANQLSHIFTSLTEEKEKAQQLEDLLQNNLSLFNDVQESLSQLENKRALVEEMQEVIEKSETNMNIVTTTSEEINNRIGEMNEYAQEIQGQLQVLQDEMKVLAGDQTKFKSAVSKLEDLEHMTVHIDAEMKRLDKMRDWIAKAVNDVERKQGSSDDSNASEDTDVKNILRLYEKDWSIDDIAKNFKLTPTYVELIIERYRS